MKPRCLATAGVAFFALFFCTASVKGARIDVPSTLFPTIQSAINAAANSDVIVVQPGTYSENIDFLSKNISVYGTSVTNVSIIDRTIIDGGNRPGSVVTFQGGQNRTAVLSGFTITHGKGTYMSGAYRGGGIYCANSSPTIACNKIMYNSAVNGYGGGVYITGLSAPWLKGNFEISRNNEGGAANWGGGICVYDTRVVVGQTYSMTRIADNILIRDNQARSGGGGIYSFAAETAIIGNTIVNNGAGDGGGVSSVFATSNSQLSNNQISLNTASSNGGGIYCMNSDIQLYNNLIHRNSARAVGGGIYMIASASLVDLNTIAYNTNNGMYIDAPAVPTITNSIVWGNSGIQIATHNSQFGTANPSVGYCCIQGGGSDNHNISQDPLFVLPPPAGENYYLSYMLCQTQQSPCIDMGNKDAVSEGTTRQCDKAQDFGTIDLGYHYPASASTPLPGQIIMNEVLYHGVANYQNDTEWIELYNCGGSDVNLTGWYIVDSNNDGTVTSFPILPADAIIHPGQYKVLGNEGTPGSYEIRLNDTTDWVGIGHLRNGAPDSMHKENFDQWLTSCTISWGNPTNPSPPTGSIGITAGLGSNISAYRCPNGAPTGFSFQTGTPTKGSANVCH